MPLPVPSLVIDGAAPEYAQHMTTDVNDALSRIAIATDDANAALETSIADMADDVTALEARASNCVTATYTVIAAFVIVLLVSAFSSFYPAWLAMRVTPRQAMQEDE